MSHPLYNPYASGNQSSNKVPYGLSNLQSGMDPRRQISVLGPGSSFSSPGGSSATPSNSGGRVSTLLAQSVSYRPEQSRATVDEDLERSIDMHISRAREGHISGRGPASSFRSSAVSSATPANSGGRIPTLLAQSAGYRPEQSRAGMDEDVESSKDTHSSRAREDVRFHGKQDYQPIGQNTRFNSTQRDDILSSGTGTTSYPIASHSASLGHRHPDVDGGGRSLDWLPEYKTAATDDSSKFYSLPASSSYTSSGGSKFNFSSDRERDVQSIPGLGDFDYPVQDKPAAPTETSRPKYTSECASSILLQFGLEKDDLEYLISYPEDQITPANLPFILRQIRIQKSKRPSTAVESKPHPEPRPIRDVSGGSSAVLQPTKVIEYGHTGKYVGGMVDETGRTSGRSTDSGASGSLSLDTYEQHSSSNRQEQLQKDTTEVKSSALSTSRVQTSSVTNVGPSYSSFLSFVAPPSSDPAKRLQTQPNQTPQPIFSTFSLPKKDTDKRVFTCEAPKPLPFKEPEADRLSMSKIPQSATVLHGAHPGQRGVVLIDKTYPSGTQSKTQGQQSVVPEQTRKQQKLEQTQPEPKVQSQQMQKAQTTHKTQMTHNAQMTHKGQMTHKAQMTHNVQMTQKGQTMKNAQSQQMHKSQSTQKAQSQQMQSTQKAQSQQMQSTQKAQSQQMQKAQTNQKAQSQQMQRAQAQQTQPVPQTGNRFWTPVLPADALLSGTMNTVHTMQHAGFIPGDPRSAFVPPAPIQPSPNTWDVFGLMTRRLVKLPGLQKLPTTAMMHDYAAASPRVFPHTCSLCHKECTSMTDWISHQNTNLHLDSCRYLRTLYPEWNGEIVPAPSAAAKDAKPSPSTSAKTSQERHKKTSHGSRSCSKSPSPRRQRSPEDRRKNRSRSQSPRSSRYTRSLSHSRSPRYYRYRSRSRSHERQRTKDDRRSSSRGEERWSPPIRSRERRLSQRRRDDRLPSPRRGRERGPSPRRDDRRFSPRRSHERPPSPSRSEERWSSPRSNRESRLSPRRRDNRRSSPRMSRERQSPSETLPEQRSSSAEKLVKKLLENSAVQSLSKQSDLEAVVKSLAPALLAELAKMKSSPSSSVSSPKGGKRSSSSATASSSSSSMAAKKKATTWTKPNFQKSEADKSSPPTIVRLGGILTCLSHSDVLAAVELYGKTKSVLMIRTKQEAVVCFEKEEYAQELKSVRSVVVKGIPVTVVTKKTAQQKKTPQKKPVVATKATKTNPPKRALLPMHLKTSPKGPQKPLTSRVKTKTVAKGSTKVTKANVLVTKAKTASTKPIAKMAKPAVQQVDTAEVHESANVTVAEPTQVSEIVTEVKVKEETASSLQEPKTPVKNLSAAGATIKEEVEEKSAEPIKETLKSPDSGNRNDVETSESKELDTKVQQSVEELEDTVKVVPGNRTVSELKHQAEPAKVDAEVRGEAEPMALRETGVEVAEPMEVEPRAEVKVEQLTSTEAVTDKPSESRPPPSTDENNAPTVLPPKAEADGRPADTSGPKPPEAPDEASSQLLEPESAAPVLEVKMEASQPSSSAEGMEENTIEKDLVSAVTNQRDPASAGDESQAVGNVSAVSLEIAAPVKIEPKAAVVSQQQPAAASSSTSAKVSTALTVGEMVERRLLRKKITCLHNKTAFSKRLFQLGKKTMMISNLPKYFDGCYTEEALANLLVPYGFEYKDENIYVIPQSRMAFVLMSSVNDVHYILTVYRRNQVVFNNCFLELSVVDNGIAMTPIGFYKSLMKRMSYPVLDIGDRTIFITNISPSEARDLRQALRKIGSIVNYLPLLNKVFVQFESSRDADRLGVWYSLLKRAPAHKVRRLKMPHTGCTALAPRIAAKAMPDSEDIVAGAVVPITKFGVPLGSISPFWVTMQASPYVFPTISPWFIIPEYLSVKGNEDIEKANRHASTFPTIMLTGLPEGDYRHEDVAMLVWPYFPKQNLRSLYYNVIVLTLQRRAFVHFSDWATCCRFARDHIANPVSVGGLVLNIHFVLQNMFPDSKEELMYTSMMKWSNAGVPEPEGLEERLLCVEISEMTVDLIKMVMTVVESIATYVNFLPLANRICVEMFDSGGVARVVKKYNTFSPGSQAKRVTLKKVIRFEPLKSLKQRLEEANEIAINLSVVPAEAGPPAQPPPPPAESSSVAGGETEKDGEKLGAEIAPDSTAGPQADRDVEKVLERREEGSPTARDASADVACGPAPSASGMVTCEETAAGLPQIDLDTVRALKAAVRQHKRSQEKRGPSEEKESSSKCSASVKNENAARGKKTWYSDRGPVDFTEDHISSDAYLFDDQNFNMSDFVTVDEVGPDPHRSSSSKKSKKKKRQHLALRSSQSWAPSSHSSSKSTEVAAKSSSSANLTSVSTKKPKDQSQSTKPSSSSSSLSQREAVAASDHSASAEGIAAITVESEPEIETSSKMHPPAQGQGSGLNQAQNLEGQTQKDDFEKHKEEEEEDDDGENYQILDSFDVQTDEHMDDGNQVGGSETQLPEPENGRILNEENFQVLDSVSDDGETHPEKSSEEGATENQAATSQEERPSLVEHDGSTAKQLSEEDVIPVGDRSDDKPALEEAIVENQEANIDDSFQVLGMGRKRASKGKGGAKERQLKEEDKIISSGSCKASNNVNKPHEQIPKDLPLNVREKKDVDVNEQESFEILDSIDDQTTMDDDSQKVETPSDQTSKDIEEEDIYQVVDSIEDQQTTTETESEVNATTRKDDGSSKRSGPRTRAFKSEEKEKSQRKQDRAVKKSETRTKTGTTAEPSKKDQEIEEEVYEILDSIEEEPVQDATATERSVRRRSQRGKKEDKTEASEKLDGDEETLYEVLDSVEEETATEQPTVMTRSTRGIKGRTSRKGSPIDKKKEEDTPTRRRRTPARESQERTTKNKEKASPKEEEEKRSDITVREVRDEDATYEILDSVEDEEVFVQKDPEDLIGGVTQQETNEILDSMDNQTAIDDETPGDQISKEAIGHIEEEEDTYQVVDSVGDRPTTVVTESEVDATARKDDGSSKSSGPRTRQDRTVKKSETSKKIMCEIDSVEDEPVQDATATERSVRRRSQRGKKEDKMTFNLTEASEKPDGDEEILYEVLDSVEDETAIEEPTVTTRSTRGRRERTSKKDSTIHKTKEEDTPTRRRRTPARESAKKSDITVRESRDEDATYEILDSVEDEEVVKDDRPATGGRGKRGRPKKAVKATKKETVTLKKGNTEKEADEEVMLFQILDSVEDEMVDDHPSTEQSVSARKKKTSKKDKLVEQSSSLSGSPRNEEEEEPVYQIVDSVEDDQVQEESGKETSKTKVETCPKEEVPAVEEDSPTCSSVVVEASEELVVKDSEDLSAAEESGLEKKERSGVKKEDASTPSEEKKNPESTRRNDTASALVSLDEVSDEEEDYPDDTAEEEELRKRQATAKKKQLAKEQEREREERKTREREERQRRSRGSSSQSGGRKAKEEKVEADTKEQEKKTRERGRRSLSSSSQNDGRKAKERGEEMVKVDTKKQEREQEEKKTREGEQRKAKEEEEEVEVNIKELVTLDEVGADEAGEEAPAQGREWDDEITAEDLQGLVTLDEVVEEEEEEEEEEEGKAEQSTPEPRPPSKDDESVDSLNPDTLVTVDEARGDEEEETRDEAETTARSVKRKINVDTEESVDFVTVDEVEEEEVKEAPRTRGRPRKRTKKTPVRKSTRGKKAGAKDDREEERESAGTDAPLPLASPDKDPSTLSSDGQREIQKAEVDGASQAHVDAATAGQDLQPEHPESQSLEEGWSRADVTVVSKRRRRELVGPEAKRSRSQSPCASADLKLPPFSPDNPLGQEFVVPKSGYFCNLCRVFYLNESSAKEEHCGSQRHYDNLQKHYQKLEDEPSRGSTQYSQGSVSD